MNHDEKTLKLLRKISVGFVLFPQYTLEQIANYSDVNKSTIHRLFGKREDINKLIVDISNTTLNEVIELIHSPVTPEVLNDSNTQQFLNKFTEINNKLLSVSELLMYCMYSFESKEEVDKFMGPIWSALDDFFRWGKKLNVVRIDIDSKFISDFYLSSLAGSLRSELYGRIGKHKLQNLFQDVFLHGITEK